MAPIRILLVDDFEPFRRVVRLLLQSRTDLTIVDEAVDGVEAVEKANFLKPDVILMDIGLPKRNGISAAQQIVVDSPGSKLLFVSLEASPETVQAAFQIGARGYVHKLSIESDLILAIDAVIAGRRYISSDIEPANTASERSRHEVLFYSNDAVFLESAIRFIRTALDSDGAAIAIVTASHGASLLQGLEAGGVDVDRAIREGTYTTLDAGDFLSQIVVDGLVDFERFVKILGDAVKSALQARKTEHSRVALVGECSGLLFAKGSIDGAIQMETRGVQSLDSRALDILCPYPMSAFERSETNGIQGSICAEHTAVFSG